MSEPRRIRVLYDEATIARRNEEMAKAIAATAPADLLVVAVLKGSFMFVADLIRAMHRVGMAPQVEFVHLSSYRAATVSSGQVEILRDVQSDVRGRRARGGGGGRRLDRRPGDTGPHPRPHARPPPLRWWRCTSAPSSSCCASSSSPSSENARDALPPPGLLFAPSRAQAARCRFVQRQDVFTVCVCALPPWLAATG